MLEGHVNPGVLDSISITVIHPRWYPGAFAWDTLWLTFLDIHRKTLDRQSFPNMTWKCWRKSTKIWLHWCLVQRRIHLLTKTYTALHFACLSSVLLQCNYCTVLYCTSWACETKLVSKWWWKMMMSIATI